MLWVGHSDYHMELLTIKLEIAIILNNRLMKCIELKAGVGDEKPKWNTFPAGNLRILMYIVYSRIQINVSDESWG